MIAFCQCPPPRATALLRRDCNGGPAVDFGLILPLLVVFIYGIIEMARLFFDVSVLHFAVEETARYAVIGVNTTTASCNSGAASATGAIQNYAYNWGELAVGLGVQCQDFTVTPNSNCGSADGNTGYQISISETFTTPLFEILNATNPWTLTIGAKSCYTK